MPTPDDAPSPPPAGDVGMFQQLLSILTIASVCATAIALLHVRTDDAAPDADEKRD